MQCQYSPIDDRPGRLASGRGLFTDQAAHGLVVGLPSHATVFATSRLAGRNRPPTEAVRELARSAPP